MNGIPGFGKHDLQNVTQHGKHHNQTTLVLLLLAQTCRAAYLCLLGLKPAEPSVGLLDILEMRSISAEPVVETITNRPLRG